MPKEDQVIAKKVQDDVFQLRSNPIHIFTLFFVIAAVSFKANTTFALVLLGFSFVAPLLYKKIYSKLTLRQLNPKDRIVVKRIFPKDFS